MTGTFPGIRRALLERGWVEQEDVNSNVFDLKWTLKTSDIDFSRLHPHQIVNHFSKNRHVTTKTGLSNSLRDLKWFDDVDCNTFFPRCYDLNCLDQVLEFIEDFMMVSAICTLRRFLNDGEGLFETVALALFACEAWLRAREHLTEDQESDGDLSQSEEVDAIEDSLSVPGWGLTAVEWEQVLGEKLPSLAQISQTRSQTRNWNYRCKDHGGDSEGELCSACGLKDQGLKMRAARAVRCVECPQGGSLEGPMQRLDSDDKVSNIWIVKPAGKSRGRGISVEQKLEHLADFMTPDQPHQAERWVAQKYVERPLLIDGRKFDIRQWVLVTDWNPLTVWMYGECYLRFAMSPFDLAALHDRQAHLCNNCVQRQDPAFDAARAAESMWDLPRFRDWLARQPPSRFPPAHEGAPVTGDHAWELLLRPRIEAIAVWALRCAEDKVSARRGTCELFGLDFLIDDKCKVWLLEINSSPDMASTTPVTQRLCDRCLYDMVPVILHATDPSPAPSATRGEGPEAAREASEAAAVAAGEYGQWRRIYRGPDSAPDPAAVGATRAELQLRGKRATLHAGGPAGPRLYERLQGLEGTARQPRRMLRVAGSRCEVASRTMLLKLLNTTGFPPAARPCPAPAQPRAKLPPRCQEQLEQRMEAWARARAERLETLRAEKERREAPPPPPAAGAAADVEQFVRRMQRDWARRRDQARDFDARVAQALRAA